MVMIGIASRLERPWDIQAMVRAEGTKKCDAYQYCIYPHPWATDRMKNGLLVSWCDIWPGGVILARVKFESHYLVHWRPEQWMVSCNGQAALTSGMKTNGAAAGTVRAERAIGRGHQRCVQPAHSNYLTPLLNTSPMPRSLFSLSFHLIPH